MKSFTNIVKNHNLLYIFSILILFLATAAPSNAAYCNSPCQNPCTSSRTICEGANCTTYCDNARYSVSHYSLPGVAFSYSTPNVSFSVSNEIYGIHNYYARPNIVISNGFRPIYHKNPPKHLVHRVPPKPHVYKTPPKPHTNTINKSVHPKRRH